MKVVLDTNVVVSAFLSPAGKSAIILQMVIKRDIEICVNTAILAEYEEVLCRPKFAKQIHQSAISRFFEIIHSIALNISGNPSWISMPDETDRKCYDLAKTADAYLVTGNKKHYPDDAFIKTPNEFLESINF